MNRAVAVCASFASFASLAAWPALAVERVSVPLPKHPAPTLQLGSARAADHALGGCDGVELVPDGPASWIAVGPQGRVRVTANEACSVRLDEKQQPVAFSAARVQTRDVDSDDPSLSFSLTARTPGLTCSPLPTTPSPELCRLAFPAPATRVDVVPALQKAFAGHGNLGKASTHGATQRLGWQNNERSFVVEATGTCRPSHTINDGEQTTLQTLHVIVELKEAGVVRWRSEKRATSKDACASVVVDDFASTAVLIGNRR